jgi:hypothetical protein
MWSPLDLETTYETAFSQNGSHQGLRQIAPAGVGILTWLLALVDLPAAWRHAGADSRFDRSGRSPKIPVQIPVRIVATLIKAHQNCRAKLGTVCCPRRFPSWMIRPTRRGASRACRLAVPAGRFEFHKLRKECAAKEALTIKQIEGG